MKNSLRLLLLLAILGFLSLHELLAQTPATGQPTATATPLALSLPQAVDYALKNKSTLQAARIDQQLATAQVGQIRAQGLPQLNASATITDNYKLQRSLVDFGSFAGPSLIGATLTPTDVANAQGGQAVTLQPSYADATPTPPVALALGFQWQGNGSVQATQQLFNGSYLLGLKAAKVYQQLSVRQTTQSEVDVVEQVTKAYYSTLVANERIKLLTRNVERLDTLLYQTQKTFEEGFVEKLDVQRLQVQRNNLRIEQQNAERLIQLSVALLKFQMGLDQRQPVQLTDSLSTAVLDAERLKQSLGLADADFNYQNRIEYSVLETQRDLATLDVRNQKAGYLPTLNLVGGYGFLGSARSLPSLLEFRGPNSIDNNTGFANQNWFAFGNVGLQLQIPVFDGFRKKYQVQTAKLTLERLNKGFTTLQQSIDLQRTQSQTTLQNDLDVLVNQKANLELATEVARVSKIKFQEGVGSNVELITAETDLRQAQTNYYSALYDALVAKVDFDKATGALHK